MSVVSDNRPDTSRRLVVILAFYAIFAGAAFSVIAHFAHIYPRFPGDLEVTLAVQKLRNPLFDTISNGLRWTGLPPQSQYIYGSCALFLLLFRQWLAAIVTMISAAGSAMVYFYFEALVTRPRPDPDLVYVVSKINQGSFPSGHVLVAIAVYGLLTYVALTRIRPVPWRILAAIPPTAMILILCVSRIYDGHHWISDVIGGSLIGTAWLSLMIILHQLGQMGFERLAARIRRPAIAS